MAGMSAAPRHGVAAEGPPGDEKIHWTQNPATHLFAAVQCGGAPLVRLDAPGLLDGFCRFAEESPDKNVWLNPKQPTATLGSLRLELRHELRRSGGHHGEDCLEATLTIGNSTDKPQQVAMGFATSAQPSPRIEEQHIYIPLNAAGLFGDGRFAPLGVKNFLKDCNQKVGTGDFQCHYLEPMASEPSERETRAPLLAPVVDIHHPQASWHVALFTPSDQPMRFSTFGVSNQRLAWQAGRCVTVPASGTISQRCWLMPHRGDASVAWKAFHRFAHQEDHPPIGWLRDFRVLYYDFLSSAEGENGHRGDGYDADLPHFRDFRVGMAVQHGWYPTLGDYIHPDRKTWKAMRRGKQAPTEMSFDIMRARIKATRVAGAGRRCISTPRALTTPRRCSRSCATAWGSMRKVG